MAKFTTLHSVDTEYSADSVEWCPGQDYFACGTYQLVRAEQEASASPRKGRIYLYKFQADGNNGTLDLLQSLETSAILDMKWLPGEDHVPLLATANALGQLDIYELASDQLKKLTCLALKAEEASPPLALALDWQIAADHTTQLLISDSQGNLHLLLYNPAGQLLTKLNSWPAHEFEAWTCAFDRWTPHLVFSGGDDGLLMGHDLRSQQRLWTNKAHLAGVTCLLSHPKREHQLITGSYDEHVRLFDTRAMRQPLAQLNVEGGIWRLKPHPEQQDLILTACMYKNFSLVQLKESELSLLGTYEEHTSICYGADWSPKLSKDVEGLYHMATCSFYDHKLCVSRVELE